MQVCQHALDGLVSMKLVSQRRPTAELQEELILPLNKKRKLVADSMITTIHLLRHSFSTKVKLDPTLEFVAQFLFCLKILVTTSFCNASNLKVALFTKTINTSASYFLQTKKSHPALCLLLCLR